MPTPFQSKAKFDPLTLDEMLKVPMAIKANADAEQEKYEQYQNQYAAIKALAGDDAIAAKRLQNYDAQMNALQQDMTGYYNGGIAAKARKLRDAYRSDVMPLQSALSARADYRKERAKDKSIITNEKDLNFFLNDPTAIPNDVSGNQVAAEIAAMVETYSNQKMPRLTANGAIMYIDRNLTQQDYADMLAGKGYLGNEYKKILDKYGVQNLSQEEQARLYPYVDLGFRQAAYKHQIQQTNNPYWRSNSQILQEEKLRRELSGDNGGNGGGVQRAEYMQSSRMSDDDKAALVALRREHGATGTDKEILQAFDKEQRMRFNSYMDDWHDVVIHESQKVNKQHIKLNDKYHSVNNAYQAIMNKQHITSENAKSLYNDAKVAFEYAKTDGEKKAIRTLMNACACKMGEIPSADISKYKLNTNNLNLNTRAVYNGPGVAVRSQFYSGQEHNSKSARTVSDAARQYLEQGGFGDKVKHLQNEAFFTTIGAMKLQNYSGELYGYMHSALSGDLGKSQVTLFKNGKLKSYEKPPEDAKINSVNILGDGRIKCAYSNGWSYIINDLNAVSKKFGENFNNLGNELQQLVASKDYDGAMARLNEFNEELVVRMALVAQHSGKPNKQILSELGMN